MGYPLRDRPQVNLDPQGPPSDPDSITLRHPDNGLVLFVLYAYDRLPCPELQFGIHHETVVTACQIVANNKPGYLSKFRDRNIDRVDVAPDSILLPGTYYYHLDDSTEKMYPICRDFRSWTFPHRKVPSSWSVTPSPMPLTQNRKWPSSWTALSQKIKDRDNVCLVSGSTEWLMTSYVVPKDEETWLQTNDMQFYLGSKVPYHESPKNLFSLRFDFHYGRAQFVIVPKWDRLAVHFLDQSSEFANGYHNVIFNHNHNLSHEALYARFAWAVFKRVAEAELDPKEFKFLDTQNPNPDANSEGGGGVRGDTRRMRKRKRKDEDGDEERYEEGNADDEDEADTSGTYQPAIRPLRRKQLDALSQGPNAWLPDVLFKMAPDDSRSSLEADAREIEEDLRIAGRHHPFLVNSEIEPTTYDYENIIWYPGIEIVQRRKQAYLNSHPNITAHGGIYSHHK